MGLRAPVIIFTITPGRAADRLRNTIRLEINDSVRRQEHGRTSCSACLGRGAPLSVSAACELCRVWDEPRSRTDAHSLCVGCRMSHEVAQTQRCMRPARVDPRRTHPNPLVPATLEAGVTDAHLAIVVNPSRPATDLHDDCLPFGCRVAMHSPRDLHGFVNGSRRASPLEQLGAPLKPAQLVQAADLNVVRLVALKAHCHSHCRLRAHRYLEPHWCRLPPASLLSDVGLLDRHALGLKEARAIIRGEAQVVQTAQIHGRIFVHRHFDVPLSKVQEPVSALVLTHEIPKFSARHRQRGRRAGAQLMKDLQLQVRR